ncbi:MAG: T9SS type B sorting domain-containing protein [Bacteroidetes bacterium]|nr:MAG: T9SS type B sorting domain-containing protein [Bacteroidota bacterium]
MKRLSLIIILSLLLQSVRANHITGGEIFYTLTGQSGGSYSYSVTLKLYRDHFSTGAALDPAAPIAIFDRLTGAMVWNNTIQRSRIEYLQLVSPGPCIMNPPPVYYDVGHYDFNVTLPASANGYIITYQRCCRIAGINNLFTSSSVGATYIAEIPGTNPLASAPANNSAHFVGPDTVIVCQHNVFTYSFNAMDADSDSLSYSFCNAYIGGTSSSPAPDPPAAPPYQSVPYASPFSADQPMGSGVTINPKTGLVTGIAPDAGIYVMTVCVNEYRNGLLIATQRKDLQIKVGDCSIAAANLPPLGVNCDNYTSTFTNSGDQSLIHSYFWTFGDPASGTNDTSTLANPTHVFTDTGKYTVTLVTNRGEPCTDTGSTIEKIYPGFFPAFSSKGICVNKSSQFADATTTQFGVVNSWHWDFGDASAANDTSNIQNPTYTFTKPGTYNVRLIVTCSKGCIDTIINPITIIDKPPIGLAFRDTLICNGDNLQLQASGAGNFSWTPGTNITNANTATPLVNPPTTTKYFVNLDDNGCLNKDSVNVRVVDFVTLKAYSDTTICQGDAIQLHSTGDGLHFLWTPSANMNDATLANPVATTNTTTTYQVVATIGHCFASDNVTVKTIPYPVAHAGPDTTICYNSSAQLQGSMVASSFTWTPAGSLSSSFILNPIATPSKTTAYVLTVTDNLGCPKPGRDTVIVRVLPKVNAFAGNDTAVVVGQPLHFNASGGINYLWSPPTALSSVTISDPIAFYDGSIDTIRYTVRVGDEQNCFDSASITVKIFKTNPQIFVPTAFTPNDDGVNDLFRPIGVGIKSIEYFRVYNRWGQLVFNTTVNEQGWDGKIGGKPQSTNTFVWIVKGIDYLDKPFFRKGTVTLIK